MRVYHFVNSQHGLENIFKRRLKIAQILELNDPFELFGVELTEPNLRDAFNVMKNELAQQRGLLCFSTSWHNPVQWSHYADKHRGICLGFDVPNVHLGKVNYSRKRLIASAEKFTSPRDIKESLLIKFLFTKYDHWKYESEVRSFVTLQDMDPEKKLYFADFSDSLKLKEVIVGATSTLSRGDIINSLGDLEISVSIKKAMLAFKTFKVVQQRENPLWP